MENMRFVWMPIEEGKINQSYHGYRQNGKNTFYPAVYLGNGQVKVSDKFIYENITHLLRDTNDTEKNDIYQSHFNLSDPESQMNLFGLFHDMYDTGGAVHCGRWWCKHDNINFYAINFNLKQEKCYLVGFAPCPHFNTTYKNPVAFVIEYENGFRTWSHCDGSWLKQLRDQMKETYDEYLKGL